MKDYDEEQSELNPNPRKEPDEPDKREMQGKKKIDSVPWRDVAEEPRCSH